jgi:hypothetical protein
MSGRVTDLDGCVAELEALGARSALGFWRRHLAPGPPSANHAPPCPPAAPWRPYTPAELALAACDMADAGISPEAAEGALVDLARRSGLAPDIHASVMGEIADG